MNLDNEEFVDDVAGSLEEWEEQLSERREYLSSNVSPLSLLEALTIVLIGISTVILFVVIIAVVAAP